ncbi:MAG: ATP-binding protein [Acidobacteria bacterium]|nr:ATP-binding protein [Acidobacteriota bacterium]
MPLPGGPSDKFGNRYELWWTVSQFVRMLHGQVESIRIEDPGVTKAEFVVTYGETRELHQAKRSHPDGKWTLASLAASDVNLLQAIFAELSGNSERFVFVSSSDAPELRELSERARQSESASEFGTQFLAAKGQEANFDKLKKYWSNTNVASAYDVLRRIEVRTIDEASLDEQVRWGLRALFLSDPQSVSAELRRIAEDSIHQTVTRDWLARRMATRGYQLRRLAKLDSAGPLVAEVTKNYLEGARKKLIRQSLISRTAAQTLLSRIDNESLGSDFVLTGKAGVGKTGCVVEFVESLRDRGIPVLAFRVDRLVPVSTTADLGRQLGLEESPALVLATAATAGDAVLVMDQLDAISTTSGRSADLFEAVEGLLAEARGLRERLKLHLVIVCRAFDWENDHRLRRMVPTQHAKIEVTEFTPEEVTAVLSAVGFRIELLQPRQLELLRLPQNLSLFLDASFNPTTVPKFNTAKDLFDRYWDTKRRAVNERAAPLTDQWASIIELLCKEMTRTQQLSVPREKLDPCATDYVAQMASEGVLTFDGKRYGFGHESFFDYCFARAFFAKDQPLAGYLIASEQHLFRRAQVRQVLAYIRDADRSRYCCELSALLTDSRVRIHIRDLILAMLVSVDDPGDDEWAVLEPWLNMQLAAFADDERKRDKFAALVWPHFFTSPSWFHLADRRGLIAGWLASGNDGLINVAVNYLRFHQRQFGDRVAELLEPYVGKGGDWTLRLRHVMEWANHESSRRFFELFLRLIDDGTLDEARGPIAVNSTFWSMLHGLAEARPEWIPEVIAQWLTRRSALIQQQKDENGKVPWRDIFGHDDFGSPHFHKAVEKAPVVFVQFVLPVILEITDATVYDDKSEPPKRDTVWPFLFEREHESIDGACLSSLVTALERMANDQPDTLGDTIASLHKRDTYIANFLLLSLYAAGAPRFANEAASLLCAETWRFYCGYSDSPYWVAMQLIQSIAAHCSPESLAKLEAAIRDYSPSYERTASGYRLAGRARHSLLSAIPAEYRSKSAESQFMELNRKFGKPYGPPTGVRGGWVQSPIEKQAAEKMSDEQWLRAIAKYQSNERFSWDDPTKGGAWQLAGMLREYVRNEPERFARLSLQFPPGTNPAYIERTLDGLKGATVSTKLKLTVCRKAYRESREDCGKAIAELLGSIKEPLSDDAVQMLDWLATEHPEPDKELWNVEATSGQPYYGGDILTHGINTTRGRAAEAIRDLILTDPSYIERFRDTLEHLVNDKSVSVRSCAASTLLAVARHDTPLAVSLFTSLASADERLLATQYADRFIYHGLRQNYNEMRPYIETLLRSTDARACKAGARFASLAILYKHPAADLVAEAMAGNASQRQGVAVVAAHNIAYAEYRKWCEEHLQKLFNDDDAEVRRKAASCFRQLENEPLESYEALITAFCDSAAYQEDSFPILHVLEESLRRLPGITCIVCDKFLARFSDEAKDIRTHRAGDVHMVAKLIFRTYQQHQRDEWASRCLDLIDRMCLEGIHEARSGLDDFER